MAFIVLNGYILNGYINTYVISVFSLAPQSQKYLCSSLLKIFFAYPAVEESWKPRIMIERYEIVTI